jgi:hypothetical protein
MGGKFRRSSDPPVSRLDARVGAFRIPVPLEVPAQRDADLEPT